MPPCFSERPKFESDLCCALLETNDPSKLVEFGYRWSDLMDLAITPVLEDKELAQALQNAMK